MWKRCTGCDHELPLTAFYVNNARPDGRTTQCQVCIKAKRRARYHANKDAEILSRRIHIGRYRWYQRRYHQKRRERDRIVKTLYAMFYVFMHSGNDLYQEYYTMCKKYNERYISYRNRLPFVFLPLTLLGYCDRKSDTRAVERLTVQNPQYTTRTVCGPEHAAHRPDVSRFFTMPATQCKAFMIQWYHTTAPTMREHLGARPIAA